MSEKKQSSVDWLIEQMIKYELVPKGIHFDNVLFHQAKAIHKEEIIETWYESRLLSNYISGNQYYNKTFGGQDNE